MEIMETIWPIVGVLVPALGTWAGVIVTLPNPNYRFARFLFWASALLLGATDFAWQLTTDKPLWFQAIAALLTSVAIGIVLPMLLAWTSHREHA
jgi:FtsH-binding integral membrane protein